MKNKPQIRSFKLSIILLILFFSCQTGKRLDFSKKDVKKAQKLIGLDFSKSEIDTLYRYLGENKAGYDSMRNFSLDHNVFPALLFDPHPSGFIIPKEQKSIQWNLPEAVTMPENKEDLAFYPLSQLAYLIKNKKISSEELTQLFLNRIKKYDNILLSVVTITEELALQQALKADKEIAEGIYRGPLHGIPYGIKDLAALKGYKTTWGTVPYKNQILDYTATVIEKLEAAGAVLIAKLTSGALARGDVWFGGKTKNPWDTSQGASGSSAGPGSATAAGLVAFSIGTETLGSIVAPSNRCGITGLRPTYGSVSRYGFMSLAWSMDKVGPMCRTAEDCALVFNALHGSDPKDKTAVNSAFNYQFPLDFSTLKVAYLKRDFQRDSSQIGKNNRASLELFKTLGIQLDTVELPKKFPFEAFDIILRAESGAFFDELVRTKQVDLMEEQDRSSRANSLRQSRFIPAVEYLQANRHRQVLIEQMHDIMKKYDVVISTSGDFRQTLITNLTGHPAVALPNGFDKNGRPTGIILIGKLYGEATILSLAKTYQEKTDFEEQHPPKFK